MKGTYSPLSGPLFLYVNASAAERPAVRELVTFYLQNAGKLATHVKDVPLPERAYVAVRDRFTSRRLGTAFHGDTAISLQIGDILNQQPGL